MTGECKKKYFRLVFKSSDTYNHPSLDSFFRYAKLIDVENGCEYSGTANSMELRVDTSGRQNIALTG